MTPTLSPPTDNLYKFIALFGLAIFLFSLYKSGDVFDGATRNKVELEDLKLEVNRSFSLVPGTDRLLDTSKVNRVPVMIKRLSDDLDTITKAIEKSALSSSISESLLTKVRKMQVQIDSLRIKTTEFFITLALGAILMFFGFILWYRKDQIIRDKMLTLELKEAVNKSMKSTQGNPSAA